MKSERQAMKALIESFHQDEMPRGISSLEPQGTQHRWQVLKNAYEIRVRSALEQDFPRTKTAVALKDWLKWGKDFSHTVAFKFSHLGELAPAFAAFLCFQNLNSNAMICLQKDQLERISRHSPLNEAFSETHFLEVSEDSVIQLQPTVQMTRRPDSNLWVISRNRQRFFETTVSSSLAQALEELSRGPQKVQDLMEVFASTEELSQFFVLAVQNVWLQSPQ